MDQKKNEKKWKKLGKKVWNPVVSHHLFIFFSFLSSLIRKNVRE